MIICAMDYKKFFCGDGCWRSKSFKSSLIIQVSITLRLWSCYVDQNVSYAVYFNAAKHITSGSYCLKSIYKIGETCR